MQISQVVFLSQQEDNTVVSVSSTRVNLGQELENTPVIRLGGVKTHLLYHITFAATATSLKMLLAYWNGGRFVQDQELLIVVYDAEGACSHGRFVTVHQVADQVVMANHSLHVRRLAIYCRPTNTHTHMYRSPVAHTLSPPHLSLFQLLWLFPREKKSRDTMSIE